MKNLKGAITCLKMTETKPNFSELGRVYGVDRRTAKKMYEGQNAKSNTRDKPSKLDPYQEIYLRVINLMLILNLRIGFANTFDYYKQIIIAL